MNPDLKGLSDHRSKAVRITKASWEPYRGLHSLRKRDKKETLETQCILLTMGGLRGPDGQFNGSLRLGHVTSRHVQRKLEYLHVFRDGDGLMCQGLS